MHTFFKFLLFLALPLLPVSCEKANVEPSGVDIECLPGKWVPYKHMIRGIDASGKLCESTVDYGLSSKELKNAKSYLLINADGTASTITYSTTYPSVEWVWSVKDDITLHFERTYPQGSEISDTFTIIYLTKDRMCLFDIGQASMPGGMNITTYYKRVDLL